MAEITQAMFDALVVRVTALEAALNLSAPPPPPPPSQSGNDFSCFGAAAAMVASDPIALSGTIMAMTSGFTTEPKAAVLVEFRRRSDDGVLGEVVTDGAGNFSIQVPTGGVPMDGYLSLRHPQLLTTRLYASRPYAANTSLGTVPMVSDSVLTAVYLVAGVPTEPNQSTLLASIRDCGGTTVPNATVNAIPMGRARYNLVTGIPSVAATTTTANGMAWLLGQPPGPTAIQAVLNGSMFGQTMATTIANELTYVLVTS